MFGQTMQTVERDVIQQRFEREAGLNQSITKLTDELDRLGKELESVKAVSKEKEKSHCQEMMEMIQLLEQTKKEMEEQRGEVRDQDARTQNQNEMLLLSVRELKVKLSTSRMREEDNFRTMAIMQKTIDFKND